MVYKLTSAGFLSVVAGTGSLGETGDGGAATSATFGSLIGGISIAPSGNIYIADTNNNLIRKVTLSTGVISKYAGTGTAGYGGDGGAATSAKLYYPLGVAATSSYIYIADNGNNRVRKVTASTGVITTIAGNGTQAYSGDGGAATSASLTDAWSLALDSNSDLYIGDIGLNSANCRVRKVTFSTGIISTYAGTSYCGIQNGSSLTTSAITAPKGMAFDSSNNLYIVDSNGSSVREAVYSSQTFTTYAGTGSAGFSGDGGAATSARVNQPLGVAVSGSSVYIADSSNNRIRLVQ